MTNHLVFGQLVVINAEVGDKYPEWFIWQSDQGYLPLDDMKRMLERFGKNILPHYVDARDEANASAG